MKTVFNNDMVAHVWAQQTQESGRSNNGQFYFDGRALFSYGRHYVAGYAIPKRNGAFIYLVNGDSYSVTTSQHVSLARYAVPGRCFTVNGLTELAAILDSGLNAWEYPEKNGRPCPTPRPATMEERRATLPAIKRHLESDFPGDNTAAAILDAFGQRHAEDVARAVGRRAAAKVEAAKVAAAKAEADKRAEDARTLAANGPAYVAQVIQRILAGTWGAESELTALSRRMLRAQKESKSRGWTRIAAAVAAHRARVRAVLADLDAKQRVARIRAEKRAAVAGLRQAIESARHAPAEPAAAARAFRNLADSYGTVNRVCGFMLSPATLGAMARDAEAARKVADSKAAEAEAARHAAQAEARAAWMAGESLGSMGLGRLGLGRLSCPTGGALLRAVGVERDESGAITGGTLETSHGAQVPLTHALRVFAFLKLCRARGEAWQRNGATLRVGHFQVDSVAPNGDFVAGCHRITWAEVARVSAALGVAEAVAAEDTTAHAKRA